MKFVSLSQLLGCPLFGSNSGLFTVSGFIVSLLEIKKEGRRDIKGKREGIEQERRKERKKALKEKNNLKNNTNKELL